MRSITSVFEALCAAIPESDPDKMAFKNLVLKALSDVIFTAPEAQGNIWIKVRRALVKYYSSPHPLRPTLEDIFCNTVFSKEQWMSIQHPIPLR